MMAAITLCWAACLVAPWMVAEGQFQERPTSRRGQLSPHRRLPRSRGAPRLRIGHRDRGSREQHAAEETSTQNCVDEVFSFYQTVLETLAKVNTTDDTRFQFYCPDDIIEYMNEGAIGSAACHALNLSLKPIVSELCDLIRDPQKPPEVLTWVVMMQEARRGALGQKLSKTSGESPVADPEASAAAQSVAAASAAPLEQAFQEPDIDEDIKIPPEIEVEDVDADVPDMPAVDNYNRLIREEIIGERKLREKIIGQRKLQDLLRAKGARRFKLPSGNSFKRVPRTAQVCKKVLLRPEPVSLQENWQSSKDIDTLLQPCKQTLTVHKPNLLMIWRYSNSRNWMCAPCFNGGALRPASFALPIYVYKVA